MRRSTGEAGKPLGPGLFHIGHRDHPYLVHLRRRRDVPRRNRTGTHQPQPDHLQDLSPEGVARRASCGRCGRRPRPGATSTAPAERPQRTRGYDRALVLSTSPPDAYAHGWIVAAVVAVLTAI